MLTPTVTGIPATDAADFPVFTATAFRTARPAAAAPAADAHRYTYAAVAGPTPALAPTDSGCAVACWSMGLDAADAPPCPHGCGLIPGAGTPSPRTAHHRENEQR